MLEALLLIKHLHTDWILGLFGVAVPFGLLGRLNTARIAHRSVPLGARPLLFVLAIAGVQLMYSLEMSMPVDVTIFMSGLSLLTWFVLVPVVGRSLGVLSSAQQPSPWGTLIWWLVYILLFASVLYTLITLSIIFKIPRIGLRFFGWSALLWFLTYLAFSFQCMCRRADSVMPVAVGKTE